MEHLPSMTETYALALSGLWLILTTIIVQAFVASVAHRRQKHYIPGIVDSQLGHESFVFRSHRTYRNSLENIPPMFGLSMVALFIGLPPISLGITIWVYALARLIHMALYYAIATEKNPSPRSYFYIIGVIANIVLAVNVARALL